MTGTTDDRREYYDVQVGLDRALGATLRVAPEEGEDDVALVEHTVPPTTLAAPLHRHEREDEISYVLEGQMGIQEGEEVRTIDAGEVAVKPRGRWHTFWNAGREPLRCLEIIAPGQFAHYFGEVGPLLPETGEPSEEERERIATLHETYGFEMDPGSVPALRKRHGLE